MSGRSGSSQRDLDNIAREAREEASIKQRAALQLIEASRKAKEMATDLYGRTRQAVQEAEEARRNAMTSAERAKRAKTMNEIKTRALNTGFKALTKGAGILTAGADMLNQRLGDKKKVKH